MNKKKVQKNKDEERPDFSSSYPQEYREKSDAFIDRAKQVKEHFNYFIDYTRALLNDTPLNRGDYCLDDTQKKELEECLKNWEALMKILDYIERNVKKYTNLLLWSFQGNKETGKVIHNFYMINETGFEDVDNPFFVGTEVVPDVLPLHLFDMQAFFLLLASCAVTAWKTQQDVIAIFEKDPLKIKDYLNKGLKPLFDYLFEFKEQMGDIKKEQEKTQRMIVVQGDRSSRENKSLKDVISKRNKADKRKTLTQEECAVILFQQKGIYLMKRQRYLERVGITKTKVKFPKNDTMVLRTIQRWDQHLATNGEKGSKPPKGYSREKSQMEFEIWAEDLEKQKYLRWEKKQPLIWLKENKPEDNDEVLEDEDDSENRGREDMVERFNRF